MIRRLLLAAIVGIMSLPMVAQDDDDMYFVPKKQSKDVIEFEKGDGTYDLSALDSTTMMMSDSARYFDGADDEFVCSRRMQRFDDFYCPSLYSYWDDPFWYGSYGWYSPYRSSWYWRWYGYNSWYSPWYYSWYNRLLGLELSLLGLGRAIRSLLLSWQTKPVTQLHFGRFRQRLTIRQSQHHDTQPAQYIRTAQLDTQQLALRQQPQSEPAVQSSSRLCSAAISQQRFRQQSWELRRRRLRWRQSRRWWLRRWSVAVSAVEDNKGGSHSITI